MQPFLSETDKNLFYRHLDKATVYFEYGSGGSTYQANIRKNITKLYSVESDIFWLNELEQKIRSDKLVFLYNEIDSRPDTWGYPGPNSTLEQRINYSSRMRDLNKEEQQKIDLVFIDGRFRVACCLKCFDIIKPDCLIAFDDFLNRKHYRIVLDYYNVKEKTDTGVMVILKKKPGILSIPEEVIKKYEDIPD
jgi:hypothetical protein